ncbi:MAG TPA: sugar transferase [Chitinophagales bacterium]|nr:sugar transferase [Chitinophagales bacterium]
MNKRKAILGWYVFCDYVAAVFAWYSLFLFRRTIIEGNPFNLKLPFLDNQFWVAMAIVPLVWLLFHYLTGTYTDLYKKSRLQELGKTFIVSFVGSIIIFFVLLLDDWVRRYSDYYLTFFILFGFQFFFTSFGRSVLLHIVKRNIWSGRVGFKTLMVGSSSKANELYTEMKDKESAFGFQFVGYIELNGSPRNTLTAELKELGKLADLEKIVDESGEIEEVIIAIESSEHHRLNDILNRLADRNVTIRIIPDMYDILSGTVRMNHAIGEAFIEIRPQLLNEWERITKRWFDVIASFFAILITLPVTLFVAIRIKMIDGGPVFYSQERLGQYGVPFKMLKFRSMKMNAEAAGPQLTKENDDRITSIGQTIRKYRIDELPQFINVIKGEMSIVGPRAERRYFADRIVKIAPHYLHIFKVQPGITSLGMVKYGYASTVDEMVKRLKYDIIYIENMGMALDFKIMVYTVLTVLYGRGK